MPRRSPAGAATPTPAAATSETPPQTPARSAAPIAAAALSIDTATAVAQPAFEDILQWHESEIHRFALRLTGNPSDADDLYQETMLKAYRAFGRLALESNHRAWLYRIASNTFLSDRRKRNRLDSLDQLDASIGFDLPAPEADHAAGLDAQALLGEVVAFIAALPPKQRIALTLRKFHGLGYDEIALTLACGEGAVRTNVHVALTKLRECFGERL